MPARSLDRLDALVAILLLLIGTVLALQLFMSGAWAGKPSVEDEFVYLLQAKMLARGHLTYPSPPLPEFFEAAHVLVVPRYAAKYMPGHAALVAPFAALGVAWLAPCLLLGITAALLYLGARLAGLQRWASLIAAALLLGDADVFPYFSSYLSQASSLMWVAGALAAAAAVRARPLRWRVALLFFCVCAAGMVRPFTGVALAIAALALLFRQGLPPRIAGWALLPIIGGALATALICHATTSSWTTTPWGLYARQYMPFDGPGIGKVVEPKPERGVPAHLAGLHDRFLASRQRHTWARLPSETLRRLLIVARLLPGWQVAIVFTLLGALWTPLWPGVAFALSYFLLQLTFHVAGPIYYLDLFPWLALSAAAGAQMAVRAAFSLQLRALRIGAVSALSLPALFVATPSATELYDVVSHAALRSSPYARWEPAFEWLRERRALVFIHYPAGWDWNLDLTYNDPDLSTAPLVRAIDLGERDRELLPYFPHRPAFVLDAVSLRIEQIR